MLLSPLPAIAAWSSVGTLGAQGNKTSGTNNLVITTSATAEAGNVIVVLVAGSNLQNTNGDTTGITIADSAGNSYSRAAEHTNGNGASGEGVTTGIYYAIAGTTLASGGTITVTTSNAITSKAASAWEFTIGAGSTLSVEASASQPDDASDPSAVSLSGLASNEYLWVAAVGHEGPSTDTFTNDADYTDFSGAGTTGGAVDTNMSIRGGHRIFTGTGDTFDCSYNARDHDQVYVALKETAAGARDPGRRSLLGVGG